MLAEEGGGVHPTHPSSSSSRKKDHFSLFALQEGHFVLLPQKDFLIYFLRIPSSQRYYGLAIRYLGRGGGGGLPGNYIYVTREIEILLYLYVGLLYLIYYIDFNLNNFQCAYFTHFLHKYIFPTKLQASRVLSCWPLSLYCEERILGKCAL